MTTPPITDYPAAIPDKGQSQAVFDANVDAFLTWLTETNVPEYQALIPWVEARRDEATAAALLAQGGAGLDLTGQGGNLIGVNAGATDVEFKAFSAFAATTAEAQGGTGDGYLTPQTGVDMLDALRAFADQVEANAGTTTDKVMSPVTTKGAYSARASELLIINDTKSDNGGDFTSGAWRVRDLNTVVHNGISGASLASNQITLPAGTYHFTASAPAYKVNNHQTRLWDVGGATTQSVGTTAQSSSGSFDLTRSQIEDFFTLTSETVFELQHRCQDTRNTDGLGLSNVFNEVKIYSQITIRKIA